VPDDPQPISPDAPPPAFIKRSPVRVDGETSHHPVSFSAWVNSDPFGKEKLLSHDACSHASVVTPGETESLGSRLDTLTTALQDHHDAASTIRTHRREARAFGAWLTAQHYPRRDCNALLRERYLRSCASPSVPLHKRRRQHLTAAMHRLLESLRMAGVVAPRPVERLPETEVHQWRSRDDAYLDHGLGLAPTPRQKSLFFATRLLQTLSHRGGMTWSALTADTITAFVQADATPRKGFGPHGTATAVRSFRRFLVVQNRLPAGLDLAIPTGRRWSHAALPQPLTETDIIRLLTCCADGTARGTRNSAMLLRRSRLGRRAKEVASLQRSDVDGVHGSLLIRSSQTPAERLLPLAQEVGEALLAYLRTGRPATWSRHLFWEQTAPYLPLPTASAMTKIVTRLLATAGMARQSSGAHLFRHTVATPLVNRGASFKDVAEVLGHHTLQTTGLYAKLDLAALAQVAWPWPGGAL
jgi:site-specific recombinase XerD